MKDLPTTDIKKLHGRVVTLMVMEEAGYLILYAIDDAKKEVHVLSIEREDDA